MKRSERIIDARLVSRRLEREASIKPGASVTPLLRDARNALANLLDEVENYSHGILADKTT